MTQHTAYSFEDVAATINGRAVIGLFEGDNAIELAPGADRSSIMVGASGDSIISRSTDRSKVITVRLQHTSPTHSELARIDAQIRSGGTVFFPMAVTDTGSGEGGSAQKVTIRSAPTKSMGQNATVREWVLHTGEWIDRIPNVAQ